MQLSHASYGIWEQGRLPLSSATWEGGLFHIQEPSNLFNCGRLFFRLNWLYNATCTRLVCHDIRFETVVHPQVGDSHGRARESSEYLESLTQQAVTLQRAINHIYSSVSSTCLAPLKVFAPKTHKSARLHSNASPTSLDITDICMLASLINSLFSLFSLVFHSQPPCDSPTAQPCLWDHPGSTQVPCPLS